MRWKIEDYAIDFFELFFPRSCASCETGLNRSEMAICLACKSRFDRPRIHDKKNNIIEKRFWGKVEIEGATTMARYVKNGLLQHAIYALKYKQNKSVGIELGRELGYELKESERFNEIDLIIPVPLHKKKEKTRGYNQCDYIATGIAETLGTEWSNSCLARLKHTKSQTGKSTYKRNQNTAGIFKATGQEYLENKRVLLIDDVITTGSTLESCVKALEKTPGIKIFVATIASA